MERVLEKIFMLKKKEKRKDSRAKIFRKDVSDALRLLSCKYLNADGQLDTSLSGLHLHLNISVTQLQAWIGHIFTE